MSKYKGFFSPEGTMQGFVSFLITRLIMLVIFIITAVGFMVLSVPYIFGSKSYKEITYEVVSKENGTGIYENYYQYESKYTFDGVDYTINMYSKTEYELGYQATFYVNSANPNQYSMEKPSELIYYIEFIMGVIMAGAVVYIFIMLPIGLINYKKRN